MEEQDTQIPHLALLALLALLSLDRLLLLLCLHIQCSNIEGVDHVVGSDVGGICDVGGSFVSGIEANSGGAGSRGHLAAVAVDAAFDGCDGGVDELAAGWWGSGRGGHGQSAKSHGDTDKSGKKLHRGIR